MEGVTSTLMPAKHFKKSNGFLLCTNEDGHLQGLIFDEERLDRVITLGTCLNSSISARLIEKRSCFLIQRVTANDVAHNQMAAWLTPSRLGYHYQKPAGSLSLTI